MTIDKMKAAMLELAANGGKPADPEAKKLVEALTSVTWSKAPDGEPCPKGCECHLEAGDSPCPIHGDADE
jgi:hypothetical protein